MTSEPVDTLIKATGLSRRAFAKQYGVGEQVLLRLSQGRFTKVPESVINAIYLAYDHQLETLEATIDEYTDQQSLQAAYRAWRESRQPVGELPERIPNIPGKSPAQRLAVAVGSMSKLAAVLHVHDFVVRRYVNGETRELPRSMRESMEKLGWGNGAESLDRHQKLWLDKHSAKEAK
jgi:transcriptional regulator with XRE-family HTH domain